MKKLLLTILLISFSQIFGQSISEINKNLNISDTINNDKEIRIYKWFSTTNGSELFRMFKNDKQAWVIELYKHYNPVKKEVNISIGSNGTTIIFAGIPSMEIMPILYAI